MRKVETACFDEGGPEHTQATLHAAKKRSVELDLEAVIVRTGALDPIDIHDCGSAEVAACAGLNRCALASLKFLHLKTDNAKRSLAESGRFKHVWCCVVHAINIADRELASRKKRHYFSGSKGGEMIGEKKRLLFDSLDSGGEPA